MYDKRKFSAQLNELLDRRGLRRKDLAELLDTSGATVSRYTSGDRVPDIETLVEIGRILHVSIDELLGVDIPEPVAPPVDIATLTACYSRASEQDRDVLWMLLARYMTPEETAAIAAMRTKQEGRVG